MVTWRRRTATPPRRVGVPRDPRIRRRPTASPSPHGSSPTATSAACGRCLEPLTYRSLDQLAIRGLHPAPSARSRESPAATARSSPPPDRASPTPQVAGHAGRPPPRPAQRTAAEAGHRRDLRHRHLLDARPAAQPVSPSWPNRSRPRSRPSPMTSSRSGAGNHPPPRCGSWIICPTSSADALRLRPNIMCAAPCLAPTSIRVSVGQYSPLITKYEPRMVPASFDF